MAVRVAVAAARRRALCAQGLLPEGLAHLRRLRRGLFGGSVGQDESFYDDTVDQWARREPRGLSLPEMIAFGTDDGTLSSERRALRSARFVQRELPVRLARRLMDLHSLPYIAVTNPHIKRVYESYRAAFHTLRALPPVRTVEDNARFTDILTRMVEEHAETLTALAVGLRECRRKMGAANLKLDSVLDVMLRSRISRRVLAEQHICLNVRRQGYVGIVRYGIPLADSVRRAADRCEQVCRETYGAAPEHILEGDVDATITHVPVHVDYMLYELLKNASRAVMERHSGGALGARRGAGPPSGAGVPPVVVRLCEGTEHITLRISDEGGGIGGREEMERVWRYGYSTVPEVAADEASGGGGLGALLSGGGAGERAGEGGVAAAIDAENPMAGLGFGLPMSRLYAEYFGGGLQLVDVAGYGTCAFLRLQRLESASLLAKDILRDEVAAQREAADAGWDSPAVRE